MKSFSDDDIYFVSIDRQPDSLPVNLRKRFSATERAVA